MKDLCDIGKIKRFDIGIYYLPKQSRLKGGVPLSVDTVAKKYKYVCRNGNIEGYYSGYTFANMLGVTTQIPYTIEIVSNNASAKVREIDLQGRRIILRKSRVPITNENYQILQFLDFLKDANKYSDNENDIFENRIRKYIVDEKIRKDDVDLYMKHYPDKIFIDMKMRLYSVFA